MTSGETKVAEDLVLLTSRLMPVTETCVRSALFRFLIIGARTYCADPEAAWYQDDRKIAAPYDEQAIDL